MTEVATAPARRTLLRRRSQWAVLIPCCAMASCGEIPNEPGQEDVTTIQSPLVVSTFHDDSAPPVHVQVRVCRTDSTQRQPTNDCSVDPGYAVVGGGAWAQSTGAGALLTASYPLSDGRTWRARSKDHQTADSHHLHTYAIGIRLDGVNSAILRSMVVRNAVTFPPTGPVPSPGGSLSGPSVMLGGGAVTNTTGPGQYLTRMSASGAMWAVNSKEHLLSSPGTITAHTVSLRGSFGPGTIIEGFGALEAKQVVGGTSTVASGVATSHGTVNAGWALANIGGQATTTSGPGRLLTRVGVDGNAWTVIAQSKDQGQTSGGATTASLTQIRKRPNSHGLCNVGAALASNMDTCVATVCAADSYCCSTAWDSACVSQVTSRCNRSCADYSCSTPSYTPDFWNNDATQSFNNCYNYSTNRRTDTFAQPGRSSGESCTEQSCVNAANISKFAKNDGLIQTTLSSGCGDGRTLLAMVIAPGFDYHWYRRDINGMWTHKPGPTEATNLDNSGVTITNPETADRGVYTIFGGYFCACSSSSEGNGHSVIN